MEGRVAKGRGGELTGRQDDKAGFCSQGSRQRELPVTTAPAQCMQSNVADTTFASDCWCSCQKCRYY